MQRCLVTIVMMVVGVVLSGPVWACPASYVKSKSKDALRSSLGDKITTIANRYLSKKGVDPTSNQGRYIKPYVIGTTWVDHQMALRSNLSGYWKTVAHRTDNKSVDQCVQDALSCRHHAQHFGDAKRTAPRLKYAQARPHGG